MTEITDIVPPRRPGPFDDVAWPDKLTARVVAPGEAPRIHGYDVEHDLARHYSTAETTLLSLTGELPSEAQARAFEIATRFLSPAPVNEAPAHATVVVRICNVLTSAIIATAALALGEQARVLVAEHAAWLGCLDAGVPAPAEGWGPLDADERRSVGRLREALAAAGVEVPELDLDLGRTPALLAVLHFAGLTRAERMESAIVFARLPAAVAEGLATPTHAYKDYAVELPPIRYTEDS
jgi:hypothetical protein